MARIKSGVDIFSTKAEAQRFADHWRKGPKGHYVDGPKKLTVYLVKIGKQKKK